jgi:hypothetical protein
MARVPAAPAAVLAQADAIGVVALALIRLVVAPLAVLAGEGDSDANVSAGHVAVLLPVLGVCALIPAQAKKNPAWREVCEV